MLFELKHTQKGFEDEIPQRKKGSLRPIEKHLEQRIITTLLNHQRNIHSQGRKAWR